MPEQIEIELFDLPSFFPEKEITLRPLRYPIWTANKAKLIERYLYYFVQITKHGTYIDGFAGPQSPDEPDAWAAKLVLESEPRWLRNFFLCDHDPLKFDLLNKLKNSQPPRCKGEPKRRIEIYHADFNSCVREILSSGQTEREASFCLLDQRTFECHWATLETLATHKTDKLKIELFYFFTAGWLDRAMSA